MCHDFSVYMSYSIVGGCFLLAIKECLKYSAIYLMMGLKGKCYLECLYYEMMRMLFVFLCECFSDLLLR